MAEICCLEIPGLTNKENKYCVRTDSHSLATARRVVK